MVEHEMNSIVGAASAKVLGWTFFFFAIVAVVLYALWGFFSGAEGDLSTPNVTSLLTAPLVAGIGGYISTRIFCAIYNRAASRWGGIKLNLTELHSPMNPKWKP